MRISLQKKQKQIRRLREDKMENTKNNILKNTITVAIIATVCCFLWGSAFPSIKIGYKLFEIKSADTASQILFAGVRFVLAGILVVIVGSISTRGILLPKKSDIKSIVKLSIFQTVLQYLFFYIALANTSGVKASVIEASNVFFAIIVSALIFRLEKFTLQKLIGCIIGFAGVVLINLEGFTLNFNLTGDGFILISTIAYAVSSVLIKRYSQNTSPVLLSGWQFITGGLVLTAAGAAFGGRLNVISQKGILILLYLAFISAAAYSLWSILLKHNDVSKVAVFGFTNPVFGVILSAWWLGEKSASGIISIIALTLACAGIFIVNYKKKGKA